VLCAVYQRTGSLYPGIALHALNNSLAFGVNEGWGWQIAVLIVASLAAIAMLLALLTRRPSLRPA
jgi:membrane protease YdiL (CAAX protease family)